MVKLLFILIGIFSYQMFNSPLYSQSINKCDSIYFLWKFEECVECLDKYILSKPNDTNAYFKRARTYIELHKYEEAVLDLTKDSSLCANIIFTLYKRGYAYFCLNNYNKALEDFNYVMEKRPNDDMLFRWRGIVYYFLGKYTDAISDFNKALELFPEENSVWLYRGLAYKKLGLITEANKDFNEFNNYIDRNFPNKENNAKIYFCYYQKAIAYCGLEDKVNALIFWELAKKECKWAESDFERFYECK